MENWRRELRFDPFPPLLSSGKKALEYYARKDLLGEPAGPPRALWNLPEAKRILAGQQPYGSWRSRGAEKHPAVNYRLIETWRRFRHLVEQYGFTREDPRAALAAEFIFSCQTREGDIRGFLANQYATYYTGAPAEIPVFPARLLFLLPGGRLLGQVRLSFLVEQPGGGPGFPLPVRPAGR